MALHAGIARVCINPPGGMPHGMWLAQRHVCAEGLDMDLYATALVLADGELRAALIDLDLWFLDDAQIRAVRRAAQQATGIPAENVLPFCSHTHAGPVTFDFYRGEGENLVQDYIGCLPGWVATASAEAAKAATAVRVAVGHGCCNIAVNRDVRLPDGKFAIGCNPEGFCDPEVGVIRIATRDGDPLACIVNYACHPTVLGPENKLISPDFPGSMRAALEQATGATCLYLQGAAGDIGPIETFVADPAVARRLGARLGLEATQVYNQLTEFDSLPSLAFIHTSVELPTRSPLDDMYAKAPAELMQCEAAFDELIKTGAEPDRIAAATHLRNRLQLRARRLLRYRDRESLTVETHAIQLGDAAIAVIAGEPYGEIGAAVKERSPFGGRTLFAAYLGEPMMYIPTAAAFQYTLPPNEVKYSPCSQQAMPLVIDHALAMLHQLRHNTG